MPDKPNPPAGPPVGPPAGPSTFTAEYVSELRAENKNYRQRARDAETSLTERDRTIFAHRVADTGRLIKADDLEYSTDLDTPEALNEAIDALLESRPYLGSRPMGAVGSANSEGNESESGLMEALRGGI